MDALKDLPTDEKETLSAQQKSIVEKYVGAAPTSGNAASTSTPKWKTLTYIIAVFLAIVNPVVQGFLSKTPYFGSNYASMLALTTIIFSVCVGVVIYYM